MEPGCRFGITLVAKKKGTVLECDHFLHGRYFWNRDSRFIFAVQTEAANLRWTAKQIANEQCVGCGHDLLDNRLAGWNDLNGFAYLWRLKRQPKNFSARRGVARNKVQCVIASEPGGLNLVAELCDLLPGTVWPEHVVRKITAIAICNGSENILAVA